MPAIRREPVSQVRVRPGKPADLDALLDIEHRSFTTDRLSRRSMRHFLTSSSAVLLVAEDGGTLSGYALVLCPPRTATARLYSIAVAPHMSGRGIGPRLLAAAERAAARRGRRAMRLEVHDRNTRAIARYEKSGYRQFGRYRDYYEDHGDALRFEKVL
jgi:ribosomal-protein-alanine acetyltransferase